MKNISIQQNHRSTRRSAIKQSGVALLESLVAILIFSIGILAIMGLQAASIKNSADAKYRSDASLLTNQIIGQMWADINNLSSYAGVSYAARAAWDTQVANTLPNGTTEIDVETGNIVEVTVRWTQGNSGTQHNFVTKAQIKGN